MAYQLNDNELLEYFRLEAVHTEQSTEHTYEDADLPEGPSHLKKVEVWTRQHFLGRGHFAQVYMQREERSGVCRALKEISAHIDEHVKYHLGELLALATLSKKYPASIVRFDGWFQLSNDRLCIAMEYFKHGDLKKCATTPLPEEEAKQIITQVNAALQKMHYHKFTHRDVKPNNIFVHRTGPNWHVKLGDFSIAKRVRPGDATYLDSNIAGEHAAPEIWDRALPYTNAVDVYSLGILACWLLTHPDTYSQLDFNKYGMRKAPFPGQLLATGGVSEAGITFIHACMALDPLQRPSALNVASLQWLSGNSGVNLQEIMLVNESLPYQGWNGPFHEFSPRRNTYTPRSPALMYTQAALPEYVQVQNVSSSPTMPSGTFQQDFYRPLDLPYSAFASALPTWPTTELYQGFYPDTYRMSHYTIPQADFYQIPDYERSYRPSTNLARRTAPLSERKPLSQIPKPHVGIFNLSPYVSEDCLKKIFPTANHVMKWGYPEKNMASLSFKEADFVDFKMKMANESAVYVIDDIACDMGFFQSFDEFLHSPKHKYYDDRRVNLRIPVGPRLRWFDVRGVEIHEASNPGYNKSLSDPVAVAGNTPVAISSQVSDGVKGDVAKPSHTPTLLKSTREAQKLSSSPLSPYPIPQPRKYAPREKYIELDDLREFAKNFQLKSPMPENILELAQESKKDPLHLTKEGTKFQIPDRNWQNPSSASRGLKTADAIKYEFLKMVRETQDAGFVESEATKPGVIANGRKVDEQQEVEKPIKNHVGQGPEAKEDLGGLLTEPRSTEAGQEVHGNVFSSENEIDGASWTIGKQKQKQKKKKKKKNNHLDSQSTAAERDLDDNELTGTADGYGTPDNKQDPSAANVPAIETSQVLLTNEVVTGEPQEAEGDGQILSRTQKRRLARQKAKLKAVAPTVEVVA